MSELPFEEAVATAATGDIWLFRGTSRPDRAIQSMTNSPVNHVGMTVAIDDMPPLMWHAELGNKLVDVQELFSGPASGNPSRILFGRDGSLFMSIGSPDPTPDQYLTGDASLRTSPRASARGCPRGRAPSPRACPSSPSRSHGACT